MKERLSLSVETATAAYLTGRARRETNGNVSALVARIVRAAQLAESVRGEAAWHAAHPDYAEHAEHAEHAEAERHSAA